MRAHLIILILIINSIASTAQSRWISILPDSLPVSCLSIPGSHDSATGEGIKGIIKQGITQNKSLIEQWHCGIRVFDLRPAMCNGELHICHGPLKTKISFSSAIETLLELINKYPNEFAIVLLRQERGGNKQEECELWSREVGDYINTLGEQASIFHPAITVGEMRGKILFLSRNHYVGCNKGALIKGWNHSLQGSRSGEIVSYKDASDTVIENAILYIQDFYNPTQPEKQKAKLQAIKALIDDTTIKSDSKIWCINHLSGYCKTFLGIDGIATNSGYKENAAYNNSAIYDYLTNKNSTNCCGIIMLDYAGSNRVGKYHTYGEDVIRAIIKQNF